MEEDLEIGGNVHDTAGVLLTIVVGRREQRHHALIGEERITVEAHLN